MREGAARKRDMVDMGGHDNEVMVDDEMIDEDIDTDGVPVIAELVEDEDIFRKPSSPIH